MDERKQNDQLSKVKTFFVEKKTNEDQTSENNPQQKYSRLR